VRHAQVSLVDGLPIETHDVEIERSRSPSLAPHASFARLDRVQVRQQIGRSEPRFDGQHLIEIGRLLDRPERRGFLDRRLTDYARARHCSERHTCARQMPFPISDIGAERDVRHVNHPR